MESRKYALTHPQFRSEFYGKGYIWDYFRPTYACPHTIQAVGFGGGNGGGKWVCGLELYEGYSKSPDCVVYSFGAGGESSFEAELLQRTNCRIFVFDGTPSGKLGSEVTSLPLEMRSRISFVHVNIGALESNKSITLASAMKANNHHVIDILKVDIEGAEFDVIHQILDSQSTPPPFAQLAMEVHLDFEIPSKGRKSDFDDVVNLWEAMETKGLRGFHSGCNIVYGIGGPYKMFAIEYSFINVKRTSRIAPVVAQAILSTNG